MEISMWYLHLNSLLDGDVEHLKNIHFGFAGLHITNALGELTRMISLQSLQQ